MIFKNLKTYEEISQKCKRLSKMIKIFLKNKYPSQINISQYFFKSESVLTKCLELTYSWYMQKFPLQMIQIH